MGTSGLDQFFSAFNSQLFWGVITLILAAFALSGKLSMGASVIFLALAWIVGCVGIYRSDAIRDWYLIASWFALGAILALLGAWMMPILQPFAITPPSFLTEIPFDTGTGWPIPYFEQIPPTRRSQRYNKLSRFTNETLMKEKEVRPIEGSFSYSSQMVDERKPATNEERQHLLAEVLQYYIIDQIDEYQHSYNAVISTPGSTDKAAHRSDNYPPNRTPIAQEDFFAAISANRPSRFVTSDRFYASRRSYLISKGTTITIENKASSPDGPSYALKFHNPDTYLLSVVVTDFPLGTATGFPHGYVADPLIDPKSVLRYRFIITCHFKYYRRTNTDSVEQEQYTKWAQSLFSSLQEDLAEQ